ncbi:hypothetical protein OS493_006152 [Desmophyllum pertusum]|uniref:Uncharacterized protein n=1 Tax=Desmophyllum pertusum TaxID=174260 RepID=A0A9X0A490_9CNID|nr:hypothetical protein OS493_006152 [Desmophyllum pertusum]
MSGCAYKVKGSIHYKAQGKSPLYCNSPAAQMFSSTAQQREDWVTTFMHTLFQNKKNPFNQFYGDITNSSRTSEYCECFTRVSSNTNFILQQIFKKKKECCSTGA